MRRREVTPSVLPDARIITLGQRWLMLESTLQVISSPVGAQPGGSEEQAYDEEVGRVSKRQDRICRRLIRSAATTPAGILAKIEVAQQYIDQGGLPRHEEEDLLASAANDLRALVSR